VASHEENQGNITPLKLPPVLIAIAIILVIASQILVHHFAPVLVITPLVIATVIVSLVVSGKKYRKLDKINIVPYRIAYPTSDNARILEKKLGLVFISLGTLALIISLTFFSLGPPHILGWLSYSTAVAFILLSLPAFDGGCTRFIRCISQGKIISINLKDIPIWIALGLILSVALALRLYELQELPAGFWYDEAANLSIAQQIQEDPSSTPVFSRVIPIFYLVPTAILISILDITPSSIRLISVAFSISGIVVLFLLTRFVLGTYPALLSALLLGVMRWDINFSRIGMVPITMTLTTSLAAYLTLKAIERGHISAYGYAGVALGFGFWFYTSFYVFPIVIGCIFIHHFVTERPSLRPFISKITVMLTIALCIAAPVAQYAFLNPDSFFARIESTSVFSEVPLNEILSDIKSGFMKHALMFHSKGDLNPRHNLPGSPMLDFLSGTLLLLGLMITIVKWRNIGLFCLPVWLFIMMVPGIFTVPGEAPQALRSIGVTPAIAILITIAIYTIWITGRSSEWIILRKSTPFAVILILGVIATSNINTYFHTQANHPDVFTLFSTDETLIGEHMLKLQQEGYSMLVSGQFQYSLNRSLFANEPRVGVVKGPESIPIHTSSVWLGASIYLEPREKNFYELLNLYYPEALFKEIRPPNGGDILFYSAVISREQLEAKQGLIAEYSLADNSVKEMIQSNTGGIWLAGFKSQDMPLNLLWKGSIHINTPGEYSFILEGTADIDVMLDGRNILNKHHDVIHIKPAIGMHSILVTGRLVTRNDVFRLLWRPPNGEVTAIPTEHLYHGTIRPMGLSGRFYTLHGDSTAALNLTTTKIPDATVLTPSMDAFWYTPVVSHPYMATWDGSLNVLEEDTYTFKVHSTGKVRLTIDGFINLEHPPTKSIASEKRVTLKSGQHRIRVDYTSITPLSRFEILWANSNEELKPIPIELLSPNVDHLFSIVDSRTRD